MSEYESLKGVTVALLRNRISRTAVGPTTLRNMTGVSGSRPALIKVFGELDLNNLGSGNFADRLNSYTNHLIQNLNYKFGPARKAINLFLRDLLYSDLTRKAYGLSACEPLMECPLDSLSMKGIKRDAGLRMKIPTVSGLSIDESMEFQKAAYQIAGSKGTHAVHLDLHYWTSGE